MKTIKITVVVNILWLVSSGWQRLSAVLFAFS